MTIIFCPKDDCETTETHLTFNDLNIAEEFTLLDDEKDNVVYKKVKLWGTCGADGDNSNSTRCLCLSNNVVYKLGLDTKVKRLGGK